MFFLCWVCIIVMPCSVARGSLLTRSLADIVRKEDFVLDSEYLITLLVVVPKWAQMISTDANICILKYVLLTEWRRFVLSGRRIPTGRKRMKPSLRWWCLALQSKSGIRSKKQFVISHACFNHVCIVFFLPVYCLRTTTAGCSASLCSGKPSMTSNTKPERASRSFYLLCFFCQKILRKSHKTLCKVSTRKINLTLEATLPKACAENSLNFVRKKSCCLEETLISSHLIMFLFLRCYELSLYITVKKDSVLTDFMFLPQQIISDRDNQSKYKMQFVKDCIY